MPRTLTARRRAVWFEVMQGPAQDCRLCGPEWAEVCPDVSEDCQMMTTKRPTPTASVPLAPTDNDD